MSGEDTSVSAPGQYFRANGLDVYYEEYGAGPPLVELHGGTGTIGRVATFGARFRVVAPNMCGHGRTANPTGACSYALLADDVAAFVRALGLDQPLVVGYSDGGNTALELGMRHPGVARALIVGGAWHRFSSTYVEGMRRMLGVAGDGEPDLDRLAQTHGEWVAYWQEAHAALGGPEYWKTLVRQMWPVWMTPLDYAEADFRRITAPTLVLLGDRDETVPVEDAVALYRLIPGAELAVLPAADHLLDGRRQLYEDLVVEFLLRHGGEGGAQTS